MQQLELECIQNIWNEYANNEAINIIANSAKEPCDLNSFGMSPR